MKGPSKVPPVFTVSLNGVAIDHKKVERAVACVQDFVRHSVLTQRFFSGTEISMLNIAVAVLSSTLEEQLL